MDQFIQKLGCFRNDYDSKTEWHVCGQTALDETFPKMVFPGTCALPLGCAAFFFSRVYHMGLSKGGGGGACALFERKKTENK